MKYRINTPYLTNLEKKYLNDVIASKWISVDGKYSKIFEKKFGNLINKKFNLLVQSGTSALHLALKALNVKPKDKIIVPNFTCSANINSVAQCNATALVVEIEKDTLGLDFDLVKKAILKYKPKILQLVHVYGFPARDTFKIINLCKKKKIIVIEDASEALGAKYKNIPVGSFGDISIFSLRSEKMIGVGEGAIISTNNSKIFNNINLLASRNMPYRGKKHPYWKKYICLGEGYNYQMPHALAAIGVSQLKKFNYIKKKKIKIGKAYRKIFKNYNFAQKINNYSKPVFWLNGIIFKNLTTSKVRSLGNYLMKNKIEVRSGFYPSSRIRGVKKLFIKKNNYSSLLFEKLLILPSK